MKTPTDFDPCSRSVPDAWERARKNAGSPTSSAQRWTLVVCALALSACGQAPLVSHPSGKATGKTTGHIYVSSPKVVTREALVNDRLEQEAWLRKELKSADQAAFGFQGKTAQTGSDRVIAADSITDNYDPLATAMRERAVQGEKHSAALDELAYKIEAERRRNELDALRRGKQPAAGASAASDQAQDGTASNAPAPARPASASDASRPDSEAGKHATPKHGASGSEDPSKLNDLVSAAAAINPTRAQASPLNLFRDRLAYRDEIRSEIIDNALDDRHDLNGNTLYRLKADATVLPYADTSAWAVITFRVKHVAKDEQTWDDTYDAWLREIERYVNQLALTRIGTAEHTGTGLSELPPAVLMNMLKAAQGYRLPDASPESPTPGRSDSALVRLVDEQLDSLIQSRRIAPCERRTREESRKCLQRYFLYLATALEYRDDLGLGRYADFRGGMDGIEVRESARISPLTWMDEQAQGQVRKELLDALKRDGKTCGDRAGYVEAYATPQRVAEYQERLFEARVGQEVDPERKPRTAEPGEVLAFLKAVASSGRLAFRCALLRTEQSGSVFTYATTPKETVERVSQLAQGYEARDLALSIALLQERMGLSEYLRYVSQSQSFFEAIKRQPLVVGFAEPESDNSLGAFGWIIGPRFRISQDGTTSSFRHTVVQHGLSALVSAPAWWKEMTLTVETKWVGEDGAGRALDAGSREIVVGLPFDPLAITRQLAARWDRAPLPNPDVQKKEYVFDIGSPARILIPGTELWRKPQVTLGAQLADTVTVLTGMRGLIAEFDEVKDVGGWEAGQTAKKVEIFVWTSSGKQFIGEATLKRRIGAESSPSP